MNYLLDTQTIIWASYDNPKLSRVARTALIEGDGLFVSFASAWEYECKRVRKPFELPDPFERLLSPQMRRLDCGFPLLDRLRALPARHRDPFDRMLIAQAIEHDLTLVTSDAQIRAYPGVKTLW